MNILIADGNRKNLAFCRSVLEMDGHEVNTAENGPECLLRATTRNYELILLNWELPELSGLEICKAVRDSDPHTPILFMTSNEFLHETIIGLKFGANDYIKLPLNRDDLSYRISIFEKSDQKRLEYILTDIRVILSTFQVFKGDREIHLTRKEFLLLAYLVKHKGRVCKRHDIISEIWGTEYEYDAGIVDVFINGIRKKLHIPVTDNRIRTVRGVGYIVSEV